jgi:hypothetical protein
MKHQKTTNPQYEQNYCYSEERTKSHTGFDIARASTGCPSAVLSERKPHETSEKESISRVRQKPRKRRRSPSPGDSLVIWNLSFSKFRKPIIQDRQAAWLN